MNDFFLNFSTLIVFLHILSATIWIGGMIVIRFAIHYSIQKIADPKIKVEITLENLQRFFSMVTPSIIILFISALIMILALDFKSSSLNNIVILKEIIFTIMTINFIVIYIKRNIAQKAFNSGDFVKVRKNLEPLAKYLIPINIVLGIFAILFGVILRGF